MSTQDVYPPASSGHVVAEVSVVGAPSDSGQTEELQISPMVASESSVARSNSPESGLVEGGGLAAGPVPPASSNVTASLDSAPVRSALEAVGSIVAQTTLLTALLYYFGYMYTEILAQRFGLNATILGYSSQDYVLRSFRPIVPAFGFLLLVGLGCLGIHVKIKGWVDSGRRLPLVERLAGIMAVGGIALVVIGVLAFLGVFNALAHDEVGRLIRSHLIVLPVTVLIGVVSGAYGIQIRRVWLSSGLEREAVRHEPGWLRSLRLALVFVLIAVNVFWAAGEWASFAGSDVAKGMMKDLPNWPQAIVHSRVDLGIGSTEGVAIRRVTDAADGYPFRYGGLKYWTKSNGKYFLLSGSDTKGVRAIVLPDDDNDLWVEVLTPAIKSPTTRRQSAQPSG